MTQFIPLILFTVLTNCASQIMMKRGMSVQVIDLQANGLFSTVFSILFSPFVFIGLVIMVVSLASHLFVLSRVELSFAYPFLGLSFVLITAWGYFMLGEGVSTIRMLGVLLICSGVALVANSG